MVVPRLLCRWCLLVLLFAALLPVQASGRGRHQKHYVVPRSQPVTIDGQLGDWDLSAQIHIYVVPETAEMQSARFAMMYDAEAVYLSGVVRDNSPMMNRHDPKVDPQSAWDADVCQMFISLDPRLEYPVEGSSFAKDPLAPVGTMYLWYFTDRQEPCLALYRGMRFEKPLRPDLSENGAIPAQHFQGAYRKADDGLSYTFEYRIPWATLGLPQVPKANDLLAGVVCIFWSRPDGLKTAGGAAWAYDIMAGSGFPWQSTLCYGKLIFSATGNLDRALVEEGQLPEAPLPLRFSYDLPSDGQVTIQLKNSENLVVRLLVPQGDRRAGTNVELWNGCDDQGKPLPAGDYTWQGIHHQPIKQQFRFSAHNSGQPPYPTDDNKGGWGGDHGTPTTALAIPGGMLLAWNGCEYGWGIIKVNAKGRKQWGSKHTAVHLATDGKRFFALDQGGFHAAAGVKVFDLADGRPINYGNNQPLLLPPPGGDDKSDVMTGLAYGDGKVYASLAKRHLIAVYDAAVGELVTTWNVLTPGALAYRPDGSLAALSDGQLVAVANGTVTPLNRADLDEPAGVTAGPDGTLYVTNRGQRQDIAVLDATGKLLRRLGKPGGRPAVGRYDASGMYMPGGLALDPEGHLWVAETTDGPKRVSVWNAADGKLVNEFFGASGYFGYAYINPAIPDEIYCHNMLWKIDWKTYTTTPYTTIWRKTAPDMIEQPNPEGYGGVFRAITAANGQQYAIAGARFKNLLLRRDGDVFKPFMAAFHVARGWSLWGGLGIPELDDKDKTPDGGYLWQDANDDQRVQLSEVYRYKDKNFRPSFSAIDDQLNVYAGPGTVLRPIKWLDNGQPVYDPEKLEKTPLAGNRSAAGYHWLDPDGSVYTYQAGGRPSLAKWSATGELAWGYPGIVQWHGALNMPIVKAGRLWGMTGPLGVAGNFTGNMSYFGVCHLFQRDGIYVAALMRDGRTGGLGPDIGQPEGQGGQFVALRTEEGGPLRYFLLAGGQDGRVTEVLGLDTIQRLPGGTYTLSEADATLAKTKLDEHLALIARSQRLTLARGRKALDLAKPVSKSLDAQRSFTVRAAYDEQNLYLRYDVTSPFELTNASAEPQLLFKGGNCLDIQLAADPAAPAGRKTPAPGDLRLLVTRQKGQPFAVLYRPKVQGATGQPVLLKSPTGQETFDQVGVTDQVKLEYKPNRAGGSFQAIVTIPHALTGLAPKPGEQVAMDVGYLFGNKEGTMVAARAYWQNNSFTANVTNDVPHESRLEPAQWGQALVE